LAAKWSQSASPSIAKASEASLSACRRTSQAGLLAVREFAVYIAQAVLKAMLALIGAMIGLQVLIQSVVLPAIRRTTIIVRARLRALLLAMALLFIRVTKQIVDAALQRIEKAKEYNHDPTPEALLGKENRDSLLSVSCQAGGAKL
jgi:hypothetical protein